MNIKWGFMVLGFMGLVISSRHAHVQGVEEDLRPGCNESLAVFECAGDQLCVVATAVCNGIPDCPHGQDEAVQQCGCLANEFSCGNSCVALVKRCDRQLDCLNGEDEEDCNTYLCPMTHFKCNNHFCVPLAEVCDFVDDCGDNSDEATCSHRPCWNKEFRCSNGQCVRPGELCDGHPDCRDLSDERNCHHEDFVDCGDGNKVHRYYWCDQWPDCVMSHMDEINCHECNSSHEFRCPNGRCIRLANVCDSQCDCAPSPTTNLTADVICADEIGCNQYYTIHHGLATCKLGESLACSVPSEQPWDQANERCIAARFLCDGHNDCQNGLYLSDEFGCDNDEKDPDEKVFTCKDNRTLPAYLRCDYKHDCLHGDDEDNCTKPECGEEEFRCSSGQCISLLARCDIRIDCLDKSDEIDCAEHVCRRGMTKCQSGGQCLSNTFWCDHYLDCPDGSDEQHCGVEVCGSDQHTCDSGQCVPAGLKCFQSGAARAGCADQSNLRHCEDWECAPDQFKCKSGPCLNRSLLCDARVDCLGYWDDEDNCSFSCSTMAPKCGCRDVHINCTGRGLRAVPVDAEKEITWFYLGNNNLSKSINNQTFTHLDRLIYLDLSGNGLGELPSGVFATLWQLSVLDLHNNRLTRLTNGTFTGLASLKGLHLKENQLEVLESLAFYGLTSLKTLDLSYQKITCIQPGAFVGLRSLIGLDLSHNKISYLEQGSFRGVPKLIFIGLNGNQIRNIEPSVFLNVPALNKLVTDEFRLCCLARHASQCLPPPDEFSSCEDLMSNLVLRLCVWLLAGVAIVGNVLVIVWRSRYSYCNQVHSFLITNLALGDFLMGSYLLMIAVVDRYYRGVYFIYDSEWRSSRLCAMAGFLSTFSSELSVFTLTVITLDRFLVIIFPFRVRRLEMARTKWFMVLGWLLAALLSALPLLNINYFHNFYGRSGVCLALHITPDKPNGWEYSVFVFLFLNLVSFSVIAASYLWMFVAARTTQLAVSRERRSTDSAMAFRMSLLVVTDAACWVPIIGLGLFSLAGFTVPPQVFAWVAVFVLPLNAAVNPVLYTLSTAPFVNPARHGLLSFRQSFKFSRNTFTSTVPTRMYGSERDGSYPISKRTSIRWQPRVEPVEGMPLSSFVT